MKQIQLTKGYVVQIDDADFAFASQFNWAANLQSRTTPKVYACRRYAKNGKVEHRYLHREIMENMLRASGELLPKKMMQGREVRFKNADTLDCRRGNLELVEKGKKPKRTKEQIHESGS